MDREEIQNYVKSCPLMSGQYSTRENSWSERVLRLRREQPLLMNSTFHRETPRGPSSSTTPFVSHRQRWLDFIPGLLVPDLSIPVKNILLPSPVFRNTQRAKVIHAPLVMSKNSKGLTSKIHLTLCVPIWIARPRIAYTCTSDEENPSG